MRTRRFFETQNQWDSMCSSACMFDEKFCENISIGLNVTLKNIPKNVASVTLFSGHFFLIVNFKVTVRKHLLLINTLKGTSNINIKHSSSVKACSMNKLTIYISFKMYYNKLWCGFVSLYKLCSVKMKPLLY